MARQKGYPAHRSGVSPVQTTFRPTSAVSFQHNTVRTASAERGGTYPAAPVLTGTAGAPLSAQASVAEVLKTLWANTVNFFKGLFNRGSASAPVPQAPVNPVGSIAAQYGLLATPENVAAFQSVLGRVQSEPGVMGPGNSHVDANRELQAVLTQFGFPVPMTGQFDPPRQML
jgi:hypothetical protein